MITKKEIQEYLLEIFAEVRLQKHHYIEIYHRDGIFAATLRSGKTVVTTGVQGFLRMTNPFIPIIYNGQVLPVYQYDEFLEYCKKLQNDQRRITKSTC